MVLEPSLSRGLPPLRRSRGEALCRRLTGQRVLDGFAMPIVGEGEQHENDNYVEQAMTSN